MAGQRRTISNYLNRPRIIPRATNSELRDRPKLLLCFYTKIDLATGSRAAWDENWSWEADRHPSRTHNHHDERLQQWERAKRHMALPYPMLISSKPQTPSILHPLIPHLAVSPLLLQVRRGNLKGKLPKRTCPDRTEQPQISMLSTPID